MKNYICGICGTEHTDLDSYLKCVSKCGADWKAKEEAEKQQKRLEEVNAALNRVKAAKTYFEEQLADFEKKYPEEYKLNFKTKCGNCNDWLSPIDEDDKPTVSTFSYEDNGKDEPIIKAKVNGKDVDPKTLWDDPDTEWLAKLLGII